MEQTVESIEEAIKQLSPDQLKEFRTWYENFDTDVWDKKIERDATDGKLDALAEAAIADHKAGKSQKL